MKKNSTFKRMAAIALLVMGGSVATYADYFQCIYAKADVYLAGAGTIFFDFGLQDFADDKFAASGEIKRVANLAPGQAFIFAKAAEGWLFAGVARDADKNGQFTNEGDKHIHIWSNGYFDAIYDKTKYEDPSSSSGSMRLAEQALANMTTPTDQVFAVFTKGAVAYRAVGQEAWGKVYSSKLDNTIGDEVTFSAYGDSEAPEGGGIKYYKFSHWTNAKGEKVGETRELKVKVTTGMEVYYANFVETTQKDFADSGEKDDPNKIDWGNEQSGGGSFPWDPFAVESIKADKASSAIFNLKGQRVAQPAKGLFIKNGKKYIVK